MPTINFALPILGFGDGDAPPSIVKWRDGTVVYRGILGGFDPQPEPESPRANVISFAEYKEKKKWESESPSRPEDPKPGAA
jgi:hypothetical protein